MFLPILCEYLEKKSFDAVAFVPPSTFRQFQLMTALRERFSVVSDLPVIPVQKRYGEIVRQQKHLKKITERLKNADRTFYVPHNEERYGKVLLIDDFVGSGATLNQIAKKMIKQKVSKEVHGIGVMGVEKGFEVVKKV